METILQDVRYSIRLLRRYRGSSLVAIGTLALAIGISTALFSVIDAALLHPLPYPHPEELVELGVSYTGARTARYAPSIDQIRIWRTSGALTHAGLGRVEGFMPKIVDAGTPERLIVGSASEGFLETYGVTPLFGRLFTIEDTRDGAPAVALLGHGYWRRQFGADQQVIGRTIRIDNKPVTIVGILPPSFYRKTDVWEATPASNLKEGSGTPAVGRLRAGQSIAAAVSQLTPLVARGGNRGTDTVGARVTSMYASATSGMSSTISILTYAVALILGIACVNVAGLLLARGTVRRPEFAIRASIGASRGRLVRQQLVESTVLFVAAGAAGVALAWLSLDALASLVPLDLPKNAPPTINATALAFALALSVITATIFSLVPALRLSRTAIGAQLISSQRRHGSSLTRRSSHVLIGVEVAVTIVLLAGAVLMVRSFVNVMSKGIGYDPDRLVTMEVQPLTPAPEVNATFYPALLNAVRGLPEVAAAGAIDDLSIRGGMRSFSATRIDGTEINAYQRQVMPGYFEALGVRPVAGRLPIDTDLTSVEPTVLMNEEAVRKFFAGTSPIGSVISTSYKPVVSMRIIGIVPDIKYFGPEYEPGPEFYVVPQTSKMELFGLALRFHAGQSVSLDRLKRLADGVGPRAFVGKVAPAMDMVDYHTAKRRQRMWLLGLLGALGLSLTLVGILTMTAYAVAQRTHEVGVRMAFGAQPRRIVFEIVRDTTWPIVIGMAIGLGAAFYATRVLEKFLYQTTPRDTLTFVATAILMAVTACVAAWLPARRAARVDPVTALRAD